MNVEQMLNGDALDFRLRARIAQRAIELKEELDDSLALKIVNRFAESLEKGRSSG
jgi:hypothetical protein